MQSAPKTIFKIYLNKVQCSSTTQNVIPPDFGRKWGKECLNTKFPLLTLLCAGYSVKLIYLILFIYKLAHLTGLHIT